LALHKAAMANRAGGKNRELDMGGTREGGSASVLGPAFNDLREVYANPPFFLFFPGQPVT